MAGKRHQPEEIVVKLRQVEVLNSQGMSMADAIRKIGVTEFTYYCWRKKYGGMGTSQLKEMKAIEIGVGQANDPVNRLPCGTNERLKRLVADLTLDSKAFKPPSVRGESRTILEEAAKGNF